MQLVETRNDSGRKDVTLRCRARKPEKCTAHSVRLKAAKRVLHNLALWLRYLGGARDFQEYELAMRSWISRRG